MPLLKDGSFLLDDSSCDPYGVVEMREKMKVEKKNNPQNVSIKGEKKKKQIRSRV